MGSTLALYVGRAFLQWIVGFFAGCLGLILLVDFLELYRRASEEPNVQAMAVVIAAIYRAPTLGEQLFPFAVLFGSMGALRSLNSKMELVVARAAGVSAWQFLWPGVLIVLVLGVLAMGVYNPMAVAMKNEADRIEARIFKGSGGSETNLWLRQSGDDGQSVMHAGKTQNGGLSLLNPTVFVFDSQGRFRERIQAAEAHYREGEWLLKDATISAPETERRFFAEHRISTYLSAEQIRESLANGVHISFWTLPGHIALAERADLPAVRYRLEFQTLLAIPLLLVSMVFLAASVSMRLVRLGNAGKMILSGVIAGFVLYVVSKIAQDLGAGGLVSPIAAAWVPPSVAILLGITALLHQEDG